MRVACYERVSTQEQAEHGLSIDAQIDVLTEWAKDYTIVDHYTDLGVSARSPASKRPELQRMLRDCEAGKIDLIIFTKLDRFFRNIKEYYKVEDVLERTGVAWKAIHEDYETQTAAGRLKVNIMLAVAQDEADRTSERIKAVFEDKRKRGLVPTGIVPVGVKLENGHYVPSEDAERVREMFAAYINSRSVIGTARQYGLTASGFRYVLNNKTYLTTGIIDSQTWDTAQTILSQRGQRHVRSDRVYLFSGIVTCPHCGGRLGAANCHGTVYYRCPRRYSGSCPGIHVRESDMEEYLLSHILPAVDDVNFEIKRKRKKPVDVSALRKKQDKLTDLYMNDLITKEKYAFDFKQLQTAIDEAERERKPIPAAEIKNALEAYSGLSDEGKKAFWSNLLKRITPTQDGFDFEVIV